MSQLDGCYFRDDPCYGYGKVYGVGNGYGSYHRGWVQNCASPFYATCYGSCCGSSPYGTGPYNYGLNGDGAPGIRTDRYLVANAGSYGIAVPNEDFYRISPSSANAPATSFYRLSVPAMNFYMLNSSTSNARLNAPVSSGNLRLNAPT